MTNPFPIVIESPADLWSGLDRLLAYVEEHERDNLNAAIRRLANVRAVLFGPAPGVELAPPSVPPAPGAPEAAPGKPVPAAQEAVAGEPTLAQVTSRLRRDPVPLFRLAQKLGCGKERLLALLEANPDLFALPRDLRAGIALTETGRRLLDRPDLRPPASGEPAATDPSPPT